MKFLFVKKHKKERNTIMKIKFLKAVLAAILSMACLLTVFAFPTFALQDAQESKVVYLNLSTSYQSRVWTFSADENSYGVAGRITGNYTPVVPASDKTGANGSTRMTIRNNDWGQTSVYVFPRGGAREQNVGYKSSATYYNSSVLRSDRYIYGYNCENSVYSGIGTAYGFNYAEEVLHVGYQRFNYNGSTGHIDYRVDVLSNAG